LVFAGKYLQLICTTCKRCSCCELNIYFQNVQLPCIYSGFNFSHSDLPFPTRCCIPYVRSGLYQLVIRVKGFRVCALHCDLAITSITHCIIRICPSAWTPRFERVELCIASARTTLAVFCCRAIVKLFCCC